MVGDASSSTESEKSTDVDQVIASAARHLKQKPEELQSLSAQQVTR